MSVILRCERLRASKEDGDVRALCRASFEARRKRGSHLRMTRYLTFFYIGIYSFRPGREGRFSRALVKRSRMRRLRACLAHTSSGRLGSASGPTTWLCLQWLDADRHERGESRRIGA